jgi:hypothetical protein
LAHVPVETLIKVRRDEAEHFVRFRTSLRAAAREKLKASSEASSERIAQEIKEDLIERELVKIGDRLKLAQSVLAKKSATNVFLGTFLTVCGLLAGMGPAALLGLIPAARVGTAYSEYVEQKGEVEMQDMFFLWKAVHHGRE